MRLHAFALAALVTLHALPAAHATSVQELFLPVAGGTAHGFVAIPTGACLGVVGIVHGINHPAAHHLGHITHLAEQGFVAVAMDFRGPVDGFPLRAGADDTKAGIAHAMQLCPGRPVDLYSVSMGTAVAAMVLAEMPVFRYWVNNEGLSMLASTWAEATAIAPANAFAKNASRDIAAECGGTPAEQPGCYRDRSAALRASEYGYLKGVILTHGLNDGLVPYDQGREMRAALDGAGIPSDFYTAVRGEAGGEGTTITGYGGVNADGLAGHGTESDDTHTLTALSFRLLDDLLLGHNAPPSGRETLVDRDAGSLP